MRGKKSWETFNTKNIDEQKKKIQYFKNKKVKQNNC